MTKKVPMSESNSNQVNIDLANNEEHFKLLVESVYDYAIFLIDPNGYIQTWNAGANRFKGYKAEEIIGKHFSVFYTKSDIERKHPQYELDIAFSQGKYEEEGWRVKKDGTTFWANVVITKLVDSSGKHIGYAKVTKDLSEKKAAEEKIKESEERYRLLVSVVKDYAIFMLYPDGRIATWNEGAKRMKGYAPDEIIGKHFSIFYPEEDKKVKKPEWELEEAELIGQFEDEGWRIRKDGTKLWVNVTITAVRNEEGKLIGFSKVTRDMTERRKLEEKLRRSNEELDQRVKERTVQLEKAIQAREEFMSIVGHELRTPVTSLKLQVQTAIRQLAKNDPKTFNEKTVKFVSGAERQLDRLSHLIEDILDVSRISMDRFVIEKEILDLDVIIKEVIERFEEQSKNFGCTISLKIENPTKVLGNQLRLEQVFSNLIMNALKYGNSKPIKVNVGSFNDEIYVSVVDHGIGIDPEDQKRIFERFERAISYSNTSGIGLGLFICQKIVEAHQGTISVSSEIGKGSTFKVLLPKLKV